MKGNELIYKDNKIIEASYRLSLTEQRIILLAISQVNALEKLSEAKIFTISASQYSSVFGVEDKEAFREIKEAIDELSERWVKVIDNFDEKRKIRWVSEKSTVISNRSIEIRFTTAIAPYLSNLKGNFTKYQLVNVSDMKSIYSIRIYEMLMQWKCKRSLTLTVEELRDRLGATSKGYDAFGNIKMKIIDPSVAEINAYSDIDVTYTLIKKGKKVTAVQFTFEFKPEMEPKTVMNKQALSAIKGIKAILGQ